MTDMEFMYGESWMCRRCPYRDGDECGKTACPHIEDTEDDFPTEEERKGYDD